MAALQAIVATKRHLGRSRIYVLLDNLEAAQALRSGITTSSAWRVQKFTNLTRQITTTVQARWIPGNAGIRGNERVDRLAKEALEGDAVPANALGQMTLASFKRTVRERSDQLTTGWWTSACPSKYAELEIRMTRKTPPEFALPRAL
ncbi:hypothetical protein K3495_g11413 [Podosphaera aphanis]|nr:hypothetical protein K3495_g11413 [Podosphaera aphanis]